MKDATKILALGIVAVFVLLLMPIAAIVMLEGCTPQAPAQAAASLSYQGALDACILQAKADDGGRPEADACMCKVAMQYGREDSGVLHCGDAGGGK